MRKSPLKPMSDKRRKEARIYSKLRKEFLWEHRLCEIKETPDEICWANATDVHHRLLRGKHYLDVDTFVACCRPCHDYLHQHPKWARENGYLK